MGDSLMYGYGLSVSPATRIATALSDCDVENLSANGAQLPYGPELALHGSYIIRYGAAIALTGTTPEMFKGQLDALVTQCLAQASRVLLVGVHQSPAGPLFDPFDTAIRSVASTRRTEFVDVRVIPILTFDDIHLTQESADAVAALIVAKFKGAQ